MAPPTRAAEAALLATLAAAPATLTIPADWNAGRRQGAAILSYEHVHQIPNLVPTPPSGPRSTAGKEKELQVTADIPG